MAPLAKESYRDGLSFFCLQNRPMAVPAVNVIKSAILQSQGRAVRMISGTQLSLYFGVGLYVSANSRKGTWGTSAIKFISEQLRRELPGLRGFSEESIKKMRTFSEFWSPNPFRSPMATEMDLDKLQG